MLIVLLASGLSTCVVFGYLVVIWWLDRYEREPFWLVLLTFVWGALGGTCLSVVFSVILTQGATPLLGARVADVFATVVIAPTVEELMKGLVFVALLAFGNQVDNRTDGLIYGAATGLGFATLENLLYFVATYGQGGAELTMQVIWLRTMFSALVHCSSSAMLGMALGHAQHRAGMMRWLFLPVVGYLCAVFNHAAWNSLATLVGSMEPTSMRSLTWLIAMGQVVAVALLMFALTQSALNAEHRVMRHYLLEEARRGVLPLEHAEIIPYWSRRRRAGWLAPSAHREAYIKAATLLAFRHHQLEQAQGARRERYLEDIATLRQQVRAHVSTLNLANR